MRRRSEADGADRRSRPTIRLGVALADRAAEPAPASSSSARSRSSRANRAPTCSSYLAGGAGKGSLFVYDLLAAPRPPARLRVVRAREPRGTSSTPRRRSRQDRRARVDRTPRSPTSATRLYLGTAQDQEPSHRVEHRRRAPARPSTRRRRVPFGDEQLLLVVTPHKELGGSLLARLPWALGAFGLLITSSAVVAGRRADAPARAGREARVRERAALRRPAIGRADAAAQPAARGVPRRSRASSLAARYVAGVEGIDIGGDWYDVVQLDDGRAVSSSATSRAAACTRRR